MPKPTPDPIPSAPPQPQGQNGGGIKQWLRNSFSPKQPRSALQAPPPAPPPFNSEQFAIAFGNKFTDKLISILPEISKEDIFYIPDNIAREITPTAVNTLSPYKKSASAIKEALHKYEYRQMPPYS